MIVAVDDASHHDRRRPRAVLRFVLAALALVLVAEGAARAADDRFPTPQAWFHPSAQVKVDQMQAIADAGQRRSVVVAGTSQMAMGVDPAVLSDALPGHPSTYNAALLAGYPLVTRRFVPEEVVPRLDPDVVVLGVSHLDLQEGDDPPYDDALATSPSPWAAMERWFADRSALVRNRKALRNPSLWANLAQGGIEGLVERYRSEAIGPDGVWTYRREGSCDAGGAASSSGDDLAVERRVAPGDGAGLVPPRDPRREAAVWETVEGLTDQGIEVVLVLAPLPDCHFRTDAQRRRFAEVREELAAGAAARGARWVDVGDALDDDLFYDTGHLGEEGSVRFSELLAAALVDAGVVAG